MNRLDSRLAQLAARFGFELRLMPFFVRVEHCARFLREARHLR